MGGAIDRQPQSLRDDFFTRFYSCEIDESTTTSAKQYAAMYEGMRQEAVKNL